MPFSSIYEFLFPYWYFALRNKRYSLGLVTVSLKRKKDFKWDCKPLDLLFFKYETVEKQSNFKMKEESTSWKHWKNNYPNSQ